MLSGDVREKGRFYFSFFLNLLLSSFMYEYILEEFIVKFEYTTERKRNVKDSRLSTG